MTNANAAPPRTLHPNHLAELRASGLTDETIQAAGIHSESNAVRLGRILNWDKYPKRLGSAIVFPFCDADGANGYHQAKPDNPRRDNKGRTVKYESPRGQPSKLYIPPGVATKLESSEPDLFITEGIKKSLAATQAGFSCVGLAGVNSIYRDKKSCRLLPDLERIAWKGRRVYIVFDSDAADKPEVADAERQLAAKLAALGAIVKVIRLPAGPADENGEPTKQGVDDFLVVQGAAALHKLREEAVDPEPPQDGDGKPDSRTLDPAETGHDFLESGKVDGVPRLRFHRGGFVIWTKGRYAELATSEVRGHVIEYVNQSYSHLSANVTNNVMDQVKAKSLLSGMILPPAFLGEPPVDGNGEPWLTNEIVVTRNSMIYLPALVANATDYARPATPRFFTTAALECDFRLDAPPPTLWLESLCEWFDGDAGSIDALQEAFGYTLVVDTRQQKIFMLIGPPRSGKGTVARVWRAVVGKQNVAGPTLASLATNFGLWPLVAATLAIISDARLSGRADQALIVERLLSISGEDALTIDIKHREPLTTTLATRIVILSNELPRLVDSSGALAKRMILWKFARSFYGRENQALTDKLLAELPGILLWAIEGWRRLRERGYFVQPAAGAELIGELTDLTSPVGMFVRERCHVGEERKVERAVLYDEYKSWCEAKGRKKYEDEQGFGRALRAAVPAVFDTQPRVGGQRVRFYGGIDIRLDW
jgi:putative DNA primase/helicase